MQASNISLPAFFLAHNIIDGMWIFTAPALFLGPYYYLTLPRMAFGSYYIVGVMVGDGTPIQAFKAQAKCACGAENCLVSAMFPPNPA